MSAGICRDAGKSRLFQSQCSERVANKKCSIVEYATREQAQNAVATLSNQNLMGRLIYVREVSFPTLQTSARVVAKINGQDREAEPRFGPPGAARGGGFMGGPGGPPPFAGGHGGHGGFNTGMAGGGGRQIYVSNVCSNRHPPLYPCQRLVH